MAAIWVILLAVLAVQMCLAPIPPWQRWAGCGLIITFTLTYLWASATTPSFTDVAGPTSARAQLAPLASRLAPLLGIAALAYPLLGLWTARFLPYIAAIILYATGLGVGAVTTAALTCVVDAALLVPHWLAAAQEPDSGPAPSGWWWAAPCPSASSSWAVQETSAD